MTYIAITSKFNSSLLADCTKLKHCRLTQRKKHPKDERDRIDQRKNTWVNWLGIDNDTTDGVLSNTTISRFIATNFDNYYSASVRCRVHFIGYPY